ncbi:MAG TPA: lytic transglycosylase domain-containing protein [Bryobacteraceae bacterium]|nr:lytic transglycosylase domain-containing protein [Bryobacteraceae bacterium]
MRFPGILLLLAAGTALAGESVVLTTGARLHADRHEMDGDKIRLYDGAGYIEMDAAKVQGFESDESGLPLPGKAVPEPAAAVAPSAASPAPAPLSPQELADAAADKYGLPRKLVHSVIKAESGFQTNAVSPKGAIGLMQLMPATSSELGVDPNDPVQNVDAGARYLRDLLLKYDGKLWHALAAYNAGPAAVDKYNGVPPYAETLNYVKRIDDDYKKGN